MDKLKKIMISFGEAREIAKLMGCSTATVSLALSYKLDSDMAKRVRKMALLRGGIEVEFKVTGRTGNERRAEENA